MQKILVLGAGLVAKPLVEYLLDAGYKVKVASNTPVNAEKILNGHQNGESVLWEADDTSTLDNMISQSDIAISLLPYRFHPVVAEYCIKNSKHMVTTSYVKEDMMKLDKKAKEAGVILLNEIGLDPGIDHMSAMKIIDTVHDQGGNIDGFYSICGALPAPESSDNPFRYKFSWSPKGVILASKNNAEYLKNGKRITVSSKDLFKDRFTYPVENIEELEVYPNRDSISYIDIYGIPETKTMLRGTFRYKGWCEILDSMKELDMLSDKVSDYTNISYNEFMRSLVPGSHGDTKEMIANRLNQPLNSPAMKAFDWLGLFEDKDMAYSNTSPFEIVSDIMIAKMELDVEERDMTVLQHLFLASYPDGRNEVISSKMIDYGSPASNTSIARTVGLPAAIATDMILKGQIDITGVHIPVIREIYLPVLNQLKNAGISLEEDFDLPAEMFPG